MKAPLCCATIVSITVRGGEDGGEPDQGFVEFGRRSFDGAAQTRGEFQDSGIMKMLDQSFAPMGIIVGRKNFYRCHNAVGLWLSFVVSFGVSVAYGEVLASGWPEPPTRAWHKYRLRAGCTREERGGLTWRGRKVREAGWIIRWATLKLLRGGDEFFEALKNVNKRNINQNNPVAINDLAKGSS